MIKLHLLRHARPAPPLVQTADVPLAESGLAQAKAIVPILASLGIQRIVSSPYRRALETVQPYAIHAGIEIEIDARLREREMPFAESPHAHIERVRSSFADAAYAPEGGETFRETTARALMCLRQVAKETRSGLLLVGHGQCLTLILRTASGKADFAFWQSLPTPAIIELTLDASAEPSTFQLLDV